MFSLFVPLHPIFQFGLLKKSCEETNPVAASQNAYPIFSFYLRNRVQSHYMPLENLTAHN